MSKSKSKFGKVEWFLVLGIMLVAISPYIFTREHLTFQFDELTGPIGDTIGGITAPIVGLIGAILVYYALREQVKANEIIQRQFKSQKREENKRSKISHISGQIDLIKDELDNFSCFERKNDRGRNDEETFSYLEYKGVDAIFEFVERLQYYGESDHEGEIYTANPKLAQLMHLIDLISSLAKKISKANIGKANREYFLGLLNYQYKTKLREAFKANEEYRMENQKTCERCGKKHFGIPDEIFNKIDELDANLNSNR